MATVEVNEAIQLAWCRGILSYKLDANQLGLYSAIKSSPRARFVLECARRVGKSYLLCVVALETCLRQGNTHVVYATPTQKEAYEIVLPLVNIISSDAPRNYRPQWNGQRGRIEFRNGSYITVQGCDDKRKADRMRGSGAKLVCLDEAGFIPFLQYVLSDVLNPQTLDVNGKTIIASTPSSLPDHDFTLLAEKAESEGAYQRRTIFDNPRLTRKRIKDYIEDEASIVGMSVEEFMQSDTFRREYLAERATDKTLVVFGDDWIKAKPVYVEAIHRPDFYDAYTVLDMGGVDPHAALFGYWHFDKDALIIEDELLLREGQSTAQLAEAIQEKERKLWGATKFDGTLRGACEVDNIPKWLRPMEERECQPQPYLRVCDNDVQMAIDLAVLHGLAFVPTAKHEKHAYVNNARVMMRSGKVIVHPRCKHLDRHLRTTTWKNPRRQDYLRRHGEHGDLVDCLVYLCRNVRQGRNPYPVHWGIDQGRYFVPADRALSQEDETLVGAFGGGLQ